MFPLLLCCAAIYLISIVFLGSAMATAPEAFEDEAGFHYVRVPVNVPRARGYLVVSI